MFKIIQKEKLASTNEEAKKLLESGDIQSDTVVLAEEQFAGKGQQGCAWHSAKGKNLTFSLVLSPQNILPTEQFYISKAVSLGILAYLDELSRGFSVKWPNDIYWKNKKICGILIENILRNRQIKYSVIGIGLNVNEIDFPEYLPRAVSPAQILGKSLDRMQVLDRVLISLYGMSQTLTEGAFGYIDEAYHKRLYLKDQKTKFKVGEESFRGTIRGTMPDGRLIVETDRGELRLFAFKEIAFL